ncbi:MAG: hypothetical protein ACXWMR_16615, partial [Gemmatimonadaceae bacterium]
MKPELAYDITPGLTERDFFQHFLPEDRLLLVNRRRLSSELIARVLTQLFNHPEVDRIRRTIGQYYQALRNWEPGQEVMALAHLWMGVETITPVALRRAFAAANSDRAGIASAWGIDIRQLDGEVRKRLILHGDADSYNKAKDASDGFEHGFLSFEEVHAYS